MSWTALIVDDEAHIRRTIKIIGLWEQFGIRLIGEAADGLQALQMITEQRPDLVLLDMHMPGLDGIGILQELEKINLHIKVIIISGHDDYNYTHEAIKYGAKDYILKPIDRDELNGSLKRITGILELEKEKAYVKDQDEESSDHIPGVHLDILSQVFEYIAKNYKNEISLSRLSSMYFLNKEFLSRAFKKRYQVGITTFINQNRLNKAKEYLQKGYQVHEAAEAVGYNDVNYFSKQFKKYFNHTPSEYSEMFKNLEYSDLIVEKGL